MKTITNIATTINPAIAIAAIGTGIVVNVLSVCSSRSGWHSFMHGKRGVVVALKRRLVDLVDYCRDLGCLLMTREPAMPLCFEGTSCFRAEQISQPSFA